MQLKEKSWSADPCNITLHHTKKSLQWFTRGRNIAQSEIQGVVRAKIEKNRKFGNTWEENASTRKAMVRQWRYTSWSSDDIEVSKRRPIMSREYNDKLKRHTKEMKMYVRQHTAFAIEPNSTNDNVNVLSTRVSNTWRRKYITNISSNRP